MINSAYCYAQRVQQLGEDNRKMITSLLTKWTRFLRRSLAPTQRYNGRSLQPSESQEEKGDFYRSYQRLSFTIGRHTIVGKKWVAYVCTIDVPRNNRRKSPNGLVAISSISLRVRTSLKKRNEEEFDAVIMIQSGSEHSLFPLEIRSLVETCDND
ncbi:hypothetical protein TcasGA2_TC011378 [Tribolium castaneum]|uniref:Uncharacterized protein n=1 Tax=Tribolium castaneum TaxID=7070 RepID=D6X4B5_TRICA|nr:hypothetical protein TcasGA2_TC011378 [Tribolium castaneum]